ncbi:hypothetical protein SAMD00019534_013970 [Acytostelium subglobosum LB1]|uniref:hypothetical protein n=1 Tax=Acytostelium subglobosum LB1 TaxID=1410327 RepID=UPI000644B149|nr:hypothetical protein SAMD00019534_013970 [Acytostelium subglobosum LB1]GAM18222.1 hypothetical protein SAMD00019534_013970 [Acytostelium subglobosum LB1]|eukprot:XP_012758818.1 hypothetical protein SAMD00019534_013970 [Acytostelium subglobosum LB1]
MSSTARSADSTSSSLASSISASTTPPSSSPSTPPIRHNSSSIRDRVTATSSASKVHSNQDDNNNIDTTTTNSSTTTTTTTTDTHHNSVLSKELVFIICVAGIYVFYLLYGFCQEKLSIVRYNPDDKEKLGNYTAFLLALQSLVNYLSAKTIQLVSKERVDMTPAIQYIYTSVLIVASTFLSNKSISYISYPTQVLAKSCKPIPVLVMGMLFYKKRYPLSKILIVVTISVGVALFMLPSSSSSSKKHTAIDLDSDLYFYGQLLLIASLLVDGLIGPQQESYVHQYKPSSNSMMLNTNFWNTIFMFLVSVVNGDILPALSFMMRYPESLVLVFFYCITSALGQHFIFLTTNRFGALSCTTITTTRKFFSILASIFWFGHYISPLQWGCIILVFAGLSIDIVLSNSGSSKRKKEA